MYEKKYKRGMTFAFNENKVNTDPVTLNTYQLFYFLVTGLTCYNCNDVDTVKGCSTSTTCNADEVLKLFYILILFFLLLSSGKCQALWFSCSQFEIYFRF